MLRKAALRQSPLRLLSLRKHHSNHIARCLNEVAAEHTIQLGLTVRMIDMLWKIWDGVHPETTLHKRSGELVFLEVYMPKYV